MTHLAPRAVCARCRRPEIVCYCRFVPTLATRTRVVILQHPRERDVPINTARIASLCLPSAELHVGLRWSGSDTLARALSDPERPAALLYPGPGAIDVETSPPTSPITLVVVDGTWSQAKILVRENPALGALPRYSFRPPAPSDYRIRKEPQDDYVSTLEALAHVLGVIEGDPERFAAMLVPFRKMVDSQLAYSSGGSGGRPRVRARAAEKRGAPEDPRARLPAILRERASDLVCAYGEANAWPYGTSQRSEHGDELVQWVACRIATGETFEAFIAPKGAIAPGTPHHMAIAKDVLAAGATAGAFHAAWSNFVRPSDVVCTWGTYAAGLFVRAGGVLGPRHVDMRRAARRFASARPKVGTMDAFLERIGGSSSAARGRGRAGIRLGQLVAIVQGLLG